MSRDNFMKDIYEDFFGIETLGIGSDFSIKPLTTTKVEENTTTNLKESRDKKMGELFEKIEKLYVTDKSKNILKKMIEYIRKYNEKIESEFIPFNICLYTDSEEIVSGVSEIIGFAVSYFCYVKNGNRVEYSLYNLKNAENLDDVYTKENSVIALKDLESIIAKGTDEKEKFIHKLAQKNENCDNNFVTILVANSKEIMKNLFEKNEEIKEKLFYFEIDMEKPDTQDIFQEVSMKLGENISEEFSIALLDYISATYPNTNLSYSAYRDKLVKEIIFNKGNELDVSIIPKYEKDKSLDEIFAELNELVGLDKVKKVLNDLVSLMELRNKTEGELKIANTNLHMVFLGNPGTGKTTVARIIAQILYNLKYIKQNKLIEVTSKDLVGEYVGQTGPKTMSVIEKAMGGVLFVDEAYTLASGGQKQNLYNEEAIATLIQAMENYRSDFVVIFAGYTKEMQAFLDTNSGIVSRIGYTLEFEDYTEDELVAILKSMVKKSGFNISDEAIDRVKEIVLEHKGDKNFGNARFIRNLYEKSIIKHAANTVGNVSKKKLKTLDENDICV